MKHAGIVAALSLGIHCLLASPRELHVGLAGHAFDHLGGIADQAEAAAASGANIIYVSGLGTFGYQGLPSSEEMFRQRRATTTYLRNAKHNGIHLAIGYVCATSIVKLDTFNKEWSPAFRSQFRTPPSEWRQQDRNGNSLPSWYGGDYQPACMNNPDWRLYERFMVRQQLECGCDGIFFDNPTVHPQGCYCLHCMEKFAEFLKREGVLLTTPPPKIVISGAPLKILREYAEKHPSDFMRFRGTIARDFLADIRAHARTIKKGALITANNSLNSSDVLFSQCRTYGYNIYEMSQAEDLVVVEDMSSQPRILANGQTLEYSPTYKQLHAISHGKPVVAVTLADADYHTAPHLIRLAMAEAAANDASYLCWPTWPEKERPRMASLIRPQADFLRSNSGFLKNAQARRDAVLFLPFRKWLSTDQCKAARLAAELTRANIQYEVICEDDLGSSGWSGGTKLLLTETASDFTPSEQRRVKEFSRAGGTIVTAEKASWLKEAQKIIGTPAISIQGPSTVCAVVRDQKKRMMVHLLNLNIQRLSSFEDKVTPARDVQVRVRVPFKNARSVRALTADPEGTAGTLKFSITREGQECFIETTLPRLEIATIVVVE